MGGWARPGPGSAGAGAPRRAAQRPAASRAHVEHELPVARAVHVGAAPFAVEVVDPVVVDRIAGASGPVTDPAGGEAPHQDHPAERGTNSRNGWRAIANGTSGAADRDRPGRVTAPFFALGRKVLPVAVRWTVRLVQVTRFRGGTTELRRTFAKMPRNSCRQC